MKWRRKNKGRKQKEGSKERTSTKKKGEKGRTEGGMDVGRDRKQISVAQYESNTHSRGRHEEVAATVIFLVRSSGDRMVDRHLHQPVNEEGSICDWANRWLPQPL